MQKLRGVSGQVIAASVGAPALVIWYWRWWNGVGTRVGKSVWGGQEEVILGSSCSTNILSSFLSLVHLGLPPAQVTWLALAGDEWDEWDSAINLMDLRVVKICQMDYFYFIKTIDFVFLYNTIFFLNPLKP